MSDSAARPVIQMENAAPAFHSNAVILNALNSKLIDLQRHDHIPIHPYFIPNQQLNQKQTMNTTKLFYFATLFIMCLCANSEETIIATKTNDANVNVKISEDIAKNNFSLGFSGIHLGGATGLTAMGKLKYDAGQDFIPFIDLGIGLSGGKYGLGVVWFLEKRALISVDENEVSIKIEENTGVACKIVAIHRWNDDADRRDAWYGKDIPRDNYIGGEFNIMIHGLCISPGIYRSLDGKENYGAISYGFGF